MKRISLRASAKRAAPTYDHARCTPTPSSDFCIAKERVHQHTYAHFANANSHTLKTAHHRRLSALDCRSTPHRSQAAAIPQVLETPTSRKVEAVSSPPACATPVSLPPRSPIRLSPPASALLFFLPAIYLLPACARTRREDSYRCRWQPRVSREHENRRIVVKRLISNALSIYAWIKNPNADLYLIKKS